jgi:hypothetical protein
MIQHADAQRFALGRINSGDEIILAAAGRLQLLSGPSYELRLLSVTLPFRVTMLAAPGGSRGDHRWFVAGGHSPKVAVCTGDSILHILESNAPPVGGLLAQMDACFVEEDGARELEVVGLREDLRSLVVWRVRP